MENFSTGAGCPGLISVIVPMYNVGPYIEKCAASIQGSSYEKLEIVLVDDGSSDETVSVCENLADRDPRIKLECKPNGGVSSARNLGIDKSTGEWICFVDADDWIDEGMLQWLFDQCEKHEADLAVCGLTQHYANRVDTTESRTVVEPLMSPSAALRNVGVMQGRPVARLFKRSCVAGTRFDADLHYGEDWLFFCEVIAQSRAIYYEPRPFYHQLINREGNSGSAFGKSKTYFDAAVKVHALYESVSEDLGHLALVDVVNAASWVSRWASRAGFGEEASRYRKAGIASYRELLPMKDVPFAEKAKCAIRLFMPDSFMRAFQKSIGISC